MKITITGKNIDLGESFRTQAEERIEATLSKFFENPVSANLVAGHEGNLFRLDLTAIPMLGVKVHVSEDNIDAYIALDMAVSRIAKQLRKYKKRLVDQKIKTEPMKISVLMPEKETTDDLPATETAPLIIAEMQDELPLCTVSGAVMRMDLEGLPALMFRNVSNKRLNMVYKRKDGNIGWIDPEIEK